MVITFVLSEKIEGIDCYIEKVEDYISNDRDQRGRMIRLLNPNIWYRIIFLIPRDHKLHYLNINRDGVDYILDYVNNEYAMDFDTIRRHPIPALPTRYLIRLKHRGYPREKQYSLEEVKEKMRFIANWFAENWE